MKLFPENFFEVRLIFLHPRSVDRPLMRDKPTFIWRLNEKDIDFQEIDDNDFQVCNHFEGTAKILTTKMGFCDLLHDMRHTCSDNHEISPR